MNEPPVFEVHGNGLWYDLAKCPLFPKGLRREERNGRMGQYGLDTLLDEIHAATKNRAYTLKLHVGGTIITYQCAARPERLHMDLQDLGRTNRPGSG